MQLNTMLSNVEPMQLFDGVYMVVTVQDMLGLIVFAVFVLGCIIAGLVNAWDTWTNWHVRDEDSFD